MKAQIAEERMATAWPRLVLLTLLALATENCNCNPVAVVDSSENVSPDGVLVDTEYDLGKEHFPQMMLSLQLLQQFPDRTVRPTQG